MSKDDNRIIKHIEGLVEKSLQERINLIAIYDVDWLLKRLKKYKKIVDKLKENRHIPGQGYQPIGISDSSDSPPKKE